MEKSGWNYCQNRDCPYFPCHKVEEGEDFNCFFCFCPLYPLGEECGGRYSYTDKGIKDCSNCPLPHLNGGYEFVLNKLPKIAELAKKK